MVDRSALFKQMRYQAGVTVLARNVQGTCLVVLELVSIRIVLEELSHNRFMAAWTSAHPTGQCMGYIGTSVGLGYRCRPTQTSHEKHSHIHLDSRSKTSHEQLQSLDAMGLDMLLVTHAPSCTSEDYPLPWFYLALP